MALLLLCINGRVESHSERVWKPVTIVCRNPFRIEKAWPPPQAELKTLGSYSGPTLSASLHISFPFALEI